ncbi:hypothetical protein HMPREF9422_1025 [Streptococcus cristatus ATCC 51100]|uniref:Uncharacterized protein n=1 Tax=Streptococcus cristatus ATCC 51100 TaxID=889201 RepID=A0AAV3EDI8_STRCR|nr:hypothetical protein HMPREF9422_1025 [Streptococcus cristatus ATCC 51100]EGU66878.1 hypothetical protein HMPREF9960_1382 [Streptococcus cristatus ATCC 51100]
METYRAFRYDNSIVFSSLSVGGSSSGNSRAELANKALKDKLNNHFTHK